jgi:hypothetical protein
VTSNSATLTVAPFAPSATAFSILSVF